MSSISIMIKPVSGLCNMRCRYCFYADVMKNRKVESYGMMSEKTLESLVKNAFEYASTYASFGFQGGEPTLAGIEFYKRLIEYQKKYNKNNIGIQNVIQTNGYALDDELVEFFAQNNFLVGLSIDGTRKLHDSLRMDAQGEGTYKRALNSANLLEKYGVEYNILCVVNNFTARFPLKVFNNLKRYKYLQFIPCIDPFDGAREKFSLSTERYTSFLKTTFDAYYNCFISDNYVSVRNFDNYIRILTGYKPENCSMNGVCASYFLIESDGGVYPCDFYVTDNWRMGNINESSFIELRKNEISKRFIDTSRYINDKCRACHWYFLCRGGCRRDREPFKNDRPALNRFCESFSEFFEYAYPKMERIVKYLQNMT